MSSMQCAPSSTVAITAVLFSGKLGGSGLDFDLPMLNSALPILKLVLPSLTLRFRQLGIAKSELSIAKTCYQISSV